MQAGSPSASDSTGGTVVLGILGAWNQQAIKKCRKHEHRKSYKKLVYSENKVT